MSKQAQVSLSATDVTVIILAGGRGTRIENIYPDRPKPMVPVLGRPFLYWLTAHLAEFGIIDFVYSTGHMAEQIDAWIQNPEFSRLNRQTCQETIPLGTGGGVLNCLPFCSEWTLVVNGDGLCLTGIDKLLALREDSDISGGLIGVHVDDSERYGSLSISDDDYLMSFREKVPGNGYVNGGVYFFKTEVLRAVGAVRSMSMEREIIPRLISKGHNLSVVCERNTPFIDIGTPETLAQAESFVESHFPHLINHNLMD